MSALDESKYTVKLGTCILAMLLLSQFTAAPIQAGNTGKLVQADVQRLTGRWVRSDGGYVLELREIKKSGSLKAFYFNPRPIYVHEARYQTKKGKIHLFVELRDVNYPGSKYDLQYDPEPDRLRGTYFQAVEKQTYQIEFERSKEKSD